VTGELAGREFGEVFTVFADDPPNGPRLRIAAAAARILVTVPLIALVDAGESPWAEIRDAGQPGDGDPHGYTGALLSIDADGGPVTYRIGAYLPAARCYAAERASGPGETAASVPVGEFRATARRSARTVSPPAGLPAASEAGAMDEDAVRKLTLYGACEDCGTPRDVRTTTEPDGSALMEMFCPACSSR
jgi:hypothetical protein